MSAPTAPAPDLPDLWFPDDERVSPDADIYGQDVAAQGEQENAAQAAILAAALVEIVEMYPMLDFDNLDSSAPGWTNRTTDAVMRAYEKSFDRAVVDYDRFRAIRLGEQAAERSSLAAPLPTTPTRQAPPARQSTPTPRVPGTLAQGQSSPFKPRAGSALPAPLPSGLSDELRRQERRRPATTPKVDLSTLPGDRRAAASSPVVRPQRNSGDAERITRLVLTGAGPANVKHRTLGFAERPTYYINKDKWMQRISSPVLIEVMGAATKQIVNGQRDAVDKMRAADRVAIGYQRVVRSATPCAFCIMLASRGPAYHSTESAERVVQASAKRAVGEPYHDNCRCTSKPSYSETEPWAGDNLSFRIDWQKYTEGLDRKDALKRFRRYIEGRDLTSGRTLRSRTPQAQLSGQGAPAEAE